MNLIFRTDFKVPLSEHYIKEKSDYDRTVISEDGGCVVLYDTETEMAIEIGKLLDCIEDDAIRFVRAKQQCPFRDKEEKYCEKRYNDLSMYCDPPLNMCVCDGKCDWMTEHDMDEMKKSYDEI